ncbi:hypothetical protein Acsp03_61530 [Actinomadura sp. NBRC 104412]|nr:hypothetical protein Acsp03_61530 [Actinomadura sp. NBRC 104412]
MISAVPAGVGSPPGTGEGAGSPPEAGSSLTRLSGALDTCSNPNVPPPAGIARKRASGASLRFLYVDMTG